AHVNWKQCAWKNLNDGKDSGLIKECVFNKLNDSTSLRVAFDGEFRVAFCQQCCRRWYITFNQNECSNPVPIDAVQHPSIVVANFNLHEHRHFGGYCEGIPRGQVRVGLWVGQCVGTNMGNADASTGWMSSTRIIVEEVPAPQA
ncbi:predicted protein, partial [Nematostella vectensis]